MEEVSKAKDPSSDKFPSMDADLLDLLQEQRLEVLVIPLSKEGVTSLQDIVRPDVKELSVVTQLTRVLKAKFYRMLVEAQKLAERKARVARVARVEAEMKERIAKRKELSNARKALISCLVEDQAALDTFPEGPLRNTLRMEVENYYLSKWPLLAELGPLAVAPVVRSNILLHFEEGCYYGLTGTVTKCEGPREQFPLGERHFFVNLLSRVVGDTLHGVISRENVDETRIELSGGGHEIEQAYRLLHFGRSHDVTWSANMEVVKKPTPEDHVPIGINITVSNKSRAMGENLSYDASDADSSSLGSSHDAAPRDDDDAAASVVSRVSSVS